MLEPKFLLAAYERRFAARATCLARAPGRVNLIGDHTDYSGGFVLPMTIDRSLWIAFAPRSDRTVTVASLDFDETAEFSLDEQSLSARGWAAYVQAVALALHAAGEPLRGWQGVMANDVPIGAGLSSSAALELAVARTFAVVSGLKWNPLRMAKLCQQAENNWAGVQCGIMDQMIVAAGREGHALLLDCRSLEGESIPLPPATSIVILDTATRRSLADAAYNERRAACEAAARSLGVAALRDVDLGELSSHQDRLDQTVFRRARHVVTENDRTLLAAEAMRRADPAALGELMTASHASLRDDYEVSSPALDAIVESALAEPSCYGARMTGAGFGGCGVALVRAGSAGKFVRRVAASYLNTTGTSARIDICSPTKGAEAIPMAD